MAAVINTVSDTKFSLNGKTYAKIYQPLAQGNEHVSISNTFDSYQKILNSTHYSEFVVNGTTYNSQEALISALLLVIYNQVEGGGGSGEGVWGEITGTLSNQGDLQNALDGKIDIGDDIPWSTLTGVPSTFPPSSHTHSFSSLTSRPTTISGYGITDAYTKTQSDGRYLGISGKAADADKLDGLDSSAFVRSNTSDTVSGTLTFSSRPVFDSSGAPFTVSSTTKVTNLNADLLDGLDSSAFVRSNASDTVSGTLTFTSRPAFNGGASGSSSPFTVDSTYVVSSLNADLLDGQHGSAYVRSNTADTVSGVLTFTARPAFNSSGAPFTVSSTTKVTNLNAELLDGIDSSQFLRSDANDNKTSGYLRMNDSIELQFGSGNDSNIFHNGSNSYWDLITGNLYIRNNTTTKFTFNRTAGDLTATGDMTAVTFYKSSDERLKEDITDYTTRPIKINWREYKWKETGKTDIGVIAQEVEKNHPEFVQTNENGYKSVDYTKILIAKIAELEQRIKELENK